MSAWPQELAFLGQYFRAIQFWSNRVTFLLKTCEICSIEFSNKQTYKKHNLEKHQSGKQKCCSYCDYKHTSWANLKYHIDCKHPEHGEQKYFCEQCSKGFIYESSCKLHVSIKHDSERNQVKSSVSNDEKF